MGALHARHNRLLPRWFRHTVIKGHDDIGPNHLLRFNRALWRHMNGVPCTGMLEMSPGFVNSTMLCPRQTEHLETAAICKHRADPSHEPVHTADRPNHLHAWVHQHMIGIAAKNDLAAGCG